MPILCNGSCVFIWDPSNFCEGSITGPPPSHELGKVWRVLTSGVTWRLSCQHHSFFWVKVLGVKNPKYKDDICSLVLTFRHSIMPCPIMYKTNLWTTWYEKKNKTQSPVEVVAQYSTFYIELYIVILHVLDCMVEAAKTSTLAHLAYFWSPFGLVVCMHPIPQKVDNVGPDRGLKCT